jgi:hypothetical protein
MGKIKITERQVKMLQSLDNSRVFRISESQLKRIMESFQEFDGMLISDIQLMKSTDDRYFLGRTEYNKNLGSEWPYSRDSGFFNSPEEACRAFKEGKFSKEIQETESIIESKTVKILGDPCEYVKSISEGIPASKQITKNFKKFGKNIKDVKFENKLTGHPVAGDGGDEYNPQSVEQNIKTNKSFNEGHINESFSLELIEFAQHILQFLKEILTDPSSAGLSPIWRQMGVSRGEMFGLLADVGLITVAVIGGKKVVKVVRKNIKRKIRDLYNKLQEKPVQEDGGYPAGAAQDPSAPWNDSGDVTSRRRTNGPFDLKYYNDEFGILEYNGDLYFFYYEHMNKDDFKDYSEVPYTRHSEDDYEYGDWEIDGEGIEGYVNDNIKHLTKGVGLESFEKGEDIVKIDNDVKQEILNTWGPSERLDAVLSSIDETTSCGGGASGAFVGKLQLGEPERVEEEDYVMMGDDIELKEEARYNQPDYEFYVVCRLSKKIYGGNEYREDASEHMNELADAYPDKKFSIYRAKTLLQYNINPDDNANWATKSDLEESTTTAGGASGAYVQPMIWAKTKKDHAPAKKAWYPKGKIVGGDTENAIEGINEDAQTDTQYPEGEFVEFDDCVKFNNNDKAQKGGCSQGAVDGVVKGVKSGKSVASKNAVYYEVAKKTGKTLEEVTNILTKNGYMNNEFKVEVPWGGDTFIVSGIGTKIKEILNSNGEDITKDVLDMGDLKSFLKDVKIAVGLDKKRNG